MTRFFRNMTKKEKQITIVLGICLIAAVIFLIISKNNQNSLSVYMNDNSVNIWENENSDNLDISMIEYRNNKLNMGCMVPSDWERKDVENGVSFTHTKSNSVFQLSIKPYEPSVNNQNATSISAKLVENNYVFVNFIRLSSNSYQVMYQDKSKSVNDFIETVYWDRNNIVTLKCSFSDKNYQGIISYFDKIISSFKWNYENPITKGYIVFYHPELNIEFEIPETWVYQASNNTISFVEEASGATICLSIANTTNYLDSLTATDMTNLIKSGKNNFMMKNFSTSKNMAYASCSYYENDKQVLCDQYIFADGKRYYYISVNYYSGTLDSSIGETLSSSFKSYN